MNDANEEPGIDGDDLVRKTDLLIQQLAAARASSGVPTRSTPAKKSTSSSASASASASAIAVQYHHAGYSVPSEVTTFGLPAGGGDADEDESAGRNDATLSTADVTEDLDYLARATTQTQTSTSTTPSTTTPLRAKIMEKYRREESSSNVISGSQQPQIPSSISSQSKKKKNKDTKKKRKDGSSSTRKKKTSTGTGSRKSTSPRSDDYESTTTASASYSHSQQHQQQSGYGVDYTPSMSSSSPVPARTPSTRAPPSAMSASTPQSYAGTYQGTPNESLQEAMRQAEIAEDAARRMREAVSVHQTMDRDDGPGRYGPTPNPGPARVGPSMLETGATACIRELLSCLADPLAALAGDNAAPAGSNATGFGGMEDPHPRWARASGSYEYVPVPNVRQAFGGGDTPAAAGEGSAGIPTRTNSSGGGAHDNGAGKLQNEDGEASSERKGLLSSTGYDSNW